MKKSAFTLIELLVVIAIIALLASIALTAYPRVMERAYGIEDLNNLRNLGLGTFNYLSDNDNQLYSPTATTSWPATLQKYVTNPKSFVSPFDKNNVGAGSTTKFPVSYGVNALLMKAPTTPPTPGAFDGNMDKCTSPSELYLMTPNVNFTATGSTATFVQADSSQAPGPVISRPGAGGRFGTHGNRGLIDVLFADSHVAAVKYTDFSAADVSTDSANIHRWNPVAVAQ